MLQKPRKTVLTACAGNTTLNHQRACKGKIHLWFTRRLAFAGFTCLLLSYLRADGPAETDSTPYSSEIGRLVRKIWWHPRGISPIQDLFWPCGI